MKGDLINNPPELPGMHDDSSGGDTRGYHDPPPPKPARRYGAAPPSPIDTMTGGRVRYGDYIKTDEGFVNDRFIIEVDVLPQGDTNHPATKDKDEFYVQLTIARPDVWIPDHKTWMEGSKHGHFIQAIDHQTRDVFRGTMEECLQIVKQIVRCTGGIPPSVMEVN